jgi:hypothetical protein
MRLASPILIHARFEVDDTRVNPGLRAPMGHAGLDCAIARLTSSPSRQAAIEPFRRPETVTTRTRTAPQPAAVRREPRAGVSRPGFVSLVERDENPL